jgi:hypothetical protein
MIDVALPMTDGVVAVPRDELAHALDALDAALTDHEARDRYAAHLYGGALRLSPVTRALGRASDQLHARLDSVAAVRT